MLLVILTLLLAFEACLTSSENDHNTISDFSSTGNIKSPSSFRLTEEVLKRQHLISSTIEKTFRRLDEPLAPEDLSGYFTGTHYSSMGGVCSNLQSLTNDSQSFHTHYACVQPHGAHYIHNTMISNGKFIVFYDNATHAKLAGNMELPTIVSMHMQKRYSFSMPMEKRIGVFPPPECTGSHSDRYFDGTLHVTGRSTVKNVYHSLSDNFLTMVALILIDAYFESSLLHLPRIALIGFFPHGNSNSAVPHLKLLDDLMSAGSITLNDVSSSSSLNFAIIIDFCPFLLNLSF